MPINEDTLRELVINPSESLALELKNWISPNSHEGKAKIIKALLALRNNNGGYLLIGFNDADGTPNHDQVPENVRNEFHNDVIQGLVTKYASKPFEIYVHYPEIDGNIFILIEVPGGLKTPVVSKADLKEGGKDHIKANSFFVRTLSTNNTPSTASAQWKDWDSVIEKCFENRESDIGRFIKRHLSEALTPELLDSVGSYLIDKNRKNISIEEELLEFLDASNARFKELLSERDVEPPRHGAMEICAFISGTIGDYKPNTEFLNLLASTNPNYTGWPLWIDSRRSRRQEDHPFVHDKMWETLVLPAMDEWVKHLDFWRASPEGKFYLYRAYQDDIGRDANESNGKKVLDFVLAVLRAAEGIAVSLSFAKAMCSEEGAILSVTFRWSDLKNRELSSWANPGRYLSYSRIAYQDSVVKTVEIPLDVTDAVLIDYVSLVVRPLFEVFQGFELSNSIIEELVRKLLERRL